MSIIKLDGIIKALKAHSKETGLKSFTTQIQYKEFSKPSYYEYTNSSVLIRFNNEVFNDKHPHRPITLQCELATAIIAPIRYL